jgi:hypothetical protein
MNENFERVLRNKIRLNENKLIPRRFSSLFGGKIIQNRLYLKCERLEASTGRFDLDVHFLFYHPVEFIVRKSGIVGLERVVKHGIFFFHEYCPTNVFLEAYDVILDGLCSSIGFREPNFKIDSPRGFPPYQSCRNTS